MSVRRRVRSRGQAVVEFAFVAPVVVLLFLGAWTAADLISDNNMAAQASRAGARLAAETGNDNYPDETLATCQSGSASNPCAVDADIIDQVLPVISGKLNNATVTEIDIYQPSACTNNGTFNTSTCPPNNGAYVSGNLIDEYSISGSTATFIGPGSTPEYTLALRDQTHPDEAEIGVRVTFSYTSPTLRMFTQTDTQYTVMRLAPTE